MRTSTIAATIALICMFAAIGVARSETARGSWSVTTSDATTRLETNWSNATGTSKNSDVRSVDARTLGLADALASNGKHVQFRVTREAGEYMFEGWIANGSGGGTFEFTPNAAFFEDIRRRGIAMDTDDDPIAKEMTAADMDVTRAYVDDILRSGIALDFHQLITFRALNIDGTYIRDLASVGFGHLETHEYITLKSLKIDSGYVKYLEAHGMRNLTAREVIRAKSEQI
jgi:hypothetical protein